MTVQVDTAGLDFYTARATPSPATARPRSPRSRRAGRPSPARRVRATARVVDTFSLRGFSAAYAAINKACPATLMSDTAST